MKENCVNKAHDTRTNNWRQIYCMLHFWNTGTRNIRRFIKDNLKSTKSAQVIKLDILVVFLLKLLAESCAMLAQP